MSTGWTLFQWPIHSNNLRQTMTLFLFRSSLQVVYLLTSSSSSNAPSRAGREPGSDGTAHTPHVRNSPTRASHFQCLLSPPIDCTRLARRRHRRCVVHASAPQTVTGSRIPPPDLPRRRATVHSQPGRFSLMTAPASLTSVDAAHIPTKREGERCSRATTSRCNDAHGNP